MKLIGESKETSAFLQDADTVLLVAKDELGFAKYKKQQVIYNMLDGKIKSVKIPGKVKLIEPCKKYPFGAMTISYVVGQALDRNTCTDEQKIKLGKQMAKFIYELQILGENLSAKEIGEISKIETKTDAKAVDECLELIKPHLRDVEYRQLIQVSNIYKEILAKRTRILCHNDLGGANMLVDEDKNIIGIIDFECLGFYIPEYEFKHFMKQDEIIFNSVVDEYHALSGVLVNDRKLMHICEIITMIINLRPRYKLGQEVVNFRVGIIRDLLQNYNN